MASNTTFPDLVSSMILFLVSIRIIVKFVASISVLAVTTNRRISGTVSAGTAAMAFLPACMVLATMADPGFTGAVDSRSGLMLVIAFSNSRRESVMEE